MNRTTNRLLMNFPAEKERAQLKERAEKTGSVLNQRERMSPDRFVEMHCCNAATESANKEMDAVCLLLFTCGGLKGNTKI